MTDEPKSDAIARARGKGIEVVDGLCADGTLVDAAEVERRRGAAMTEIESDSLVVYKHRGVDRYLACVLKLPAADVARVNQLLAGLPSSEKLMFWLVAHGALRGLRPDQALQAGDVERVAEMAEAWTAERSSN